MAAHLPAHFFTPFIIIFLRDDEHFMGWEQWGCRGFQGGWWPLVAWMVWGVCLVNDPSYKLCLVFPGVCTAPTRQCREEREQTWEKSEQCRRKNEIIRHFYTMISDWGIAGILEHLMSSPHYSNLNIQPLFSCFSQCGMPRTFEKCEFYRTCNARRGQLPLALSKGWAASGTPYSGIDVSPPSLLS